MRKRKTDEASALFQQIFGLSLVLGVLGSVPALYFGAKATLGFWTGIFMCLAGLKLIELGCRRPRSQAGGFVDYSVRYALYGLVIYVSLKHGIPALSLVAGIMLQKLAVTLVPLLRKEGGHGTNQRT